MQLTSQQQAISIQLGWIFRVMVTNLWETGVTGPHMIVNSVSKLVLANYRMSYVHTFFEYINIKGIVFYF